MEPKGTRTSISSIPSLDKVRCTPPPVLARYSISQGRHSQSNLFGGVTTRYCCRSSSDLNTELLELQCKTKWALEASWEEAGCVKAKVESHREIVTNLERELTRLRSEPSRADDNDTTTSKITHLLRCFSKWNLSSELMPRNLWSSSAPEDTMQRSTAHPDVNRFFLGPQAGHRDQRKCQRHHQNNWAGLLNSTLGGLVLNFSERGTSAQNDKLVSFQKSHVALISGLRQKLHQKDSAKAALKKNCRDREQCILELQKECDLLRGRSYQEKQTGRKKREKLMREVVVLVENIRNKDPKV